MGKEKQGELRLIEAIRDIGMDAWHMDCSIDGFPDILALGDNNLSFLCEVKEGPTSTIVRTSFEPSQPVFLLNLLQKKYNNYFQCLWDGKYFHLYQILELWREVIYDGEPKRFSDFPTLLVSKSAHDIAKVMKEVARGNKTVG